MLHCTQQQEHGVMSDDLSNKQQRNAEKLAEIIGSTPPDKESSTIVMRLASNSVGANGPEFLELLDTLSAQVTKSKGKNDIREHRKCLRHILHSLIQCIFRYEWLSLPTNPGNFADGKHLNDLGFSQRRMQRCIKLLAGETEEEQRDPTCGLMYLGRKGYLDPREGKSSKASQFFPTKGFIDKLAYSLYTDFGGWDNLTAKELYRFNKFEKGTEPKLSSYKEKLQIIVDYNNFMRDQSWALKNPSARVISERDGRGGRIINFYQNIAQRRIRIRTSTLINGNTIAEPDFTANHLWLAAALFDEELPEDPYHAIVTASGLSRDKVKAVITKCLGSTSLKQKGRIIQKSMKDRLAISSEEFRRTLAALETEYPWTKKHKVFFNDRGARLQYLEGEIALKMMRWCFAEEVPMLCVHDAFAVESFNEEKTYEMMHYCRDIVVEEAKENGYLKIMDL
jgi:hypothetical protein